MIKVGDKVVLEGTVSRIDGAMASVKVGDETVFVYTNLLAKVTPVEQLVPPHAVELPPLGIAVGDGVQSRDRFGG